MGPMGTVMEPSVPCEEGTYLKLLKASSFDLAVPPKPNGLQIIVPNQLDVAPTCWSDKTRFEQSTALRDLCRSPLNHTPKTLGTRPLDLPGRRLAPCMLRCLRCLRGKQSCWTEATQRVQVIVEKILWGPKYLLSTYYDGTWTLWAREGPGQERFRA